MISQEISELLTNFKSTWSKVLDQSPILQLDDTWPSISVIDLLLGRLYGKEEFDEIDQAVVQGCAAYIGSMAIKCLAEFTQTQSLYYDDKEGICLKAEGGEKLKKGEAYFIKLEKALSLVLQIPVNSFPVFTDFSVSVFPHSKLVRLFALGVCSGLSPAAEGPWLKETAQSFQEQTVKAVKILARTSATWYERVFPEEPLGQMAELYLQGFVYPPFLMMEGHPGEYASEQLVPFLREYQFSEEQILALAKNLAQSPDEQTSCLGLVLYGALIKEEPAVEVLAVADTFGSYMGVLRETSRLIRKNLLSRLDFLEKEELAAEDFTRIRMEQKLGFLPWLVLPVARLKDKKFRALLEAMVIFDYQGVIEAIDMLIYETPGDIDIRLQKIQMDLLQPDYDAIEKDIRNLISEPGSDSNPLLYDRWATCAFYRNDFPSALKYAKKAHALTSFDHPQARDIIGHASWLYILSKDLDEAYRMLEKAAEKLPNPVPALINVVGIFRQKGEHDKADTLERILLRYAPTDPRVFDNLLSKLVLT